MPLSLFCCLLFAVPLYIYISIPLSVFPVPLFPAVFLHTYIIRKNIIIFPLSAFPKSVFVPYIIRKGFFISCFPFLFPAVFSCGVLLFPCFCAFCTMGFLFRRGNKILDCHFAQKTGDFFIVRQS